MAMIVMTIMVNDDGDDNDGEDNIVMAMIVMTIMVMMMVMTIMVMTKGSQVKQWPGGSQQPPRCDEKGRAQSH